MPGKHSAPEKPKSGKGKKIVAITLACALVLGGAGVGGYYYLHDRTGKDVDVFPVNMLGSSDSWYDRVNTGGQVRVDKMQAVYLTSTQTVTEVYVQEGQQVKVGDPLLAFDTTLDEVELTRKQIAIDQLDLDLQEAREQLEEINTYKVGSPGGGFSIPDTPAPTAEPQPTTIPLFQGGEGTLEDPYVYLWAEDMPLSDFTVEQLLLLAQPSPSPSPSQDPEASQEPEASEEPGPGGETAEVPAPGALTPVGAGQTWAVGGLISLARPGSGRMLLDSADPAEPPLPSDTPTPTSTEEPTATDTPSSTDTPEPEDTATPAPTPVPYGQMSGDEIMAMFTALKDDAPALKALYEGLTEAEKQTIVGKISAEQRQQLLDWFKAAGVESPALPDTPAQATQTPATQATEKPADATEAPKSTEEPEATSTPEPTPTPSAAPTGASYYMVFEIRANDSMQGDILRAFEIQFILSGKEWQQYWSFVVLDPMYQPQTNWVPEEPDFGGGSWFDSSQYYSASEIERMRRDAEARIRDLTLQLRMAEQELKSVQYELSNGEVLCTTDGVVKTVLDPDVALESNEAVVLVSGGGGYYVDAFMSEFDMQNLHVGDTVTVENYMAGEEVDGVITEISQYPDTDSDYIDYYTNSANGNTSKYPFTVAIDESANLREGYYVNVYFSATGAVQEEDGDGFYLENAFIRTEGSRSYVYAAGADGLLEKRYVTTGKSRYGYATEITGGLDIETDYIAFPYGRSVKAGAKAVFKEDPRSLWNGY